ncbi:MAG: sensor histidine kinase, partial [Bacteroidota bacterium]
MNRYFNKLFRRDILDSIPTENLIDRQKFKLFRTYVLITFICSTYTGYQSFSTFSGGHYLAYLLWCLSGVFIGCYFLVKKKEGLKTAYLVSLLAGCVVLHTQAYRTGGVLNTGTIYFCAAIMTSYMLLGPRYGHWFTALGVFSVISLYYSSSVLGLADDAMFNTEHDKFFDALVTFLSGLVFVAGLSSNLNSNKNEVIRRIMVQKEEMEFKNLQLKEYTDVLERKNDELDKFASIVSHDLKAPLRAIGNLTDWIEEDAGAVLDSDTRSNFNLIKQRVGRMEDLINAILEYSRADRTATLDEAVDVDAIIKDAFD